MKLDLRQVEEAYKELYIRAVKLLPPDIKEGFKRLDKTETDATGKAVLGTVPAVRNGRVHFLTGEYLTIPGPRVAQAARAIAEALHPSVRK